MFLLNTVQFLVLLLFRGSPVACMLDAIQEGDVEKVRALISHGADVNSFTTSSYAPIHVAAVNNQVSILRILLENRADVNLRDMLEGNTALHFATMKGHREITRLLLASGAELNAVNFSNRSALLMASPSFRKRLFLFDLEEPGCLIRSRVLESDLYESLKIGNVSNVQILLDLKVDVNALVNAMHSPIHVAAYFNQIAVLKLLLDRGASVDIRDRFDGNTALHIAMANGHFKCARLLIYAGANLNVVNFRDLTVRKATTSGRYIKHLAFIVEDHRRYLAKRAEEIRERFNALSRYTELLPNQNDNLTSLSFDLAANLR